jgi:hypothetical protein
MVADFQLQIFPDLCCFLITDGGANFHFSVFCPKAEKGAAAAPWIWPNEKGRPCGAPGWSNLSPKILGGNFVTFAVWVKKHFRIGFVGDRNFRPTAVTETRLDFVNPAVKVKRAQAFGQKGGQGSKGAQGRGQVGHFLHSASEPGQPRFRRTFMPEIPQFENKKVHSLQKK